MNKILLFRIFASAIALAGVGILADVIFEACSGELIEQLLPEYNKTLAHKTLALLLALPVPFHVISIGMIIQKRWLPVKLKRITWISIISSGIWLGIALIIKYAIL